MSSDSALDNSNSVFQKNEKIFMNIQGCYLSWPISFTSTILQGYISTIPDFLINKNLFGLSARLALQMT